MLRIFLVVLLSLSVIGCMPYKDTVQPIIEQPKEITEIDLGGVSDGVHYYPPQQVIPIPREIDTYVSPNNPYGYREPESEQPNPIYGGYGGGGGWYVPPVVPTVTTIWQGNITVKVE
jgi:hypothetical protein